MVVSTHMEVAMARRGKLTSISSGHSNSTGLMLFCTEWAIGDTIPGFIYATAHTYINFPIKRPGQDMLFLIVVDAPAVTSTTFCYPAVSIQKRSDLAGGFIDSTYDSTGEKAFERIYSTQFFNASSTEAESFILGPIDTLRYGCSYGSSTGEGVAANETFIRLMVGYSTANPDPHSTGGGCTHDALSTNAPTGGYYICPIQLGVPGESIGSTNIYT